MPSEKLKYLLKSEPIFSVSDYDERLKQALTALPDGTAMSLLMGVLQHDQGIRYELIAKYIPLSFQETLLLLKSFVRIQKYGEDYISEPGENEVQRVTDALIERGRALINKNEFVEAAEIGFAILLVIEMELANVFDEGITYQAIIEETFQYLLTIIEGTNLKSETRSLIFQKATGHYQSQKESDRYYDDDWQELIDKLK